MRDRRFGPVATMLLVLMLTACGGSEATSSTTAPATTASTTGEGVSETETSVVITVTGLSFPAEVEVPSGKTVRWVNESSAPHEVQMETHDGSPADMEPVRLGTDQEGELSLDPGTWDYFCTIHPAMTGTLVVQG
jgi:plastocyanin